MFTFEYDEENQCTIISSLGINYIIYWLDFDHADKWGEADISGLSLITPRKEKNNGFWSF